jgi:DNA repair exonuclease SbcCD ATPase subunit
VLIVEKPGANFATLKIFLYAENLHELLNTSVTTMSVEVKREKTEQLLGFMDEEKTRAALSCIAANDRVVNKEIDEFLDKVQAEQEHERRVHQDELNSLREEIDQLKHQKKKLKEEKNKLKEEKDKIKDEKNALQVIVICAPVLFSMHVCLWQVKLTGLKRKLKSLADDL